MTREEKKKFMEKMTGATMSGTPPTDHMDAHVFEFDKSKVEMMIVALTEAARVIKPTNEDTLVACVMISRMCMNLVTGGRQSIDTESFNIRQVLAMLDDMKMKLSPVPPKDKRS